MVSNQVNNSGTLFQDLASWLLIISISLHGASLNGSDNTASNTHQRGGVLANWILLGPFNVPPAVDTTRNDSPGKVPDTAPALACDFLGTLGGEDRAIIRNYSAIKVENEEGVREFRKAREVSADPNGFISLDSVLTGTFGEVAYAFCYVESFEVGRLRFYWGVDGVARIWINGAEIKNVWDATDSCVPLSKYFDADCLPGVNTVLVKINCNRQPARFTMETWDVRDSLTPYYQKINTLYLTVNKNEIRAASDSLRVSIHFNIPVPENWFTGNIRVFRGADSADGIVLEHVPVGETIVPIIPDTLSRMVCLEASVHQAKLELSSTIAYIWKGNFHQACDSVQKRYHLLQSVVNACILKDHLARLIVQGAFAWGHDWFTIMDSLPVTEQIRQLVYAMENAECIETLCRGERLAGNRKIPCYLPSLAVPVADTFNGYDPSTWLHYKYPDEYALPDSKDGPVGYRFWLFLPNGWGRKWTKVPLVLSLHDGDKRGGDINALEDFGPMAFAATRPDFPAVVITPHCREKTIWYAPALKKLVDAFVETGRIQKRREYITGSGMGGFATWHLATEYLRKSAAIIPINGGGDPEKACVLRTMSVWVFHGGMDRIISLEQSQDMVTALKECNNRKVEFSIYPAHGHEMYPAVYNDPRMYAWMFRQKN